MKLSELLNERKGDRSYEALERDCGGVPKAARQLIPIDRLMDALRWADNLSEVAHELWVDEQTLMDRIDTLTADERQGLIDLHATIEQGA